MDKEMIKGLPKKFFNRQFTQLSLIMSAIIYILNVLITYFNEVERINLAAGGNISEYMSIFQILSGVAYFSFLNSIMHTVFLVFMPMIILFHMVKIQIFEERHKGWKRLSIGLPSNILAINIALTLSENGFLPTMVLILNNTSYYLFIFIITLAIVMCAKWIVDGFNESNSE